jgi:CBS domain-containing protein
MIASEAFIEHEAFQRPARRERRFEIDFAQRLRQPRRIAQGLPARLRFGALSAGAPLARRRAMLAEATTTRTPTVGEMMTPRPITVARFETSRVAATLLRTCRIRHLPVLHQDVLAGVVSLRDVLPAPEDALVDDIMRAPAVTATADEPITRACERMLKERISCLPVTDGRLNGIFTATDALRFAATALVDVRPAPTVEQLMTPRPLVVIEPGATLASAWQLMRDAKVRHLPVLSSGDVVGILSDRDVLAAGREWLDEAAAGDGHPLLAADAMSTRLSTTLAERPAAEAARVLLRRRVGALPVLRSRALIGIITVSDFLYWILSRP